MVQKMAPPAARRKREAGAGGKTNGTVSQKSFGELPGLGKRMPN
jgi:hypothetical protein